ncbi:hypothetical protein SRB5_65810 [Streptomyces sp. RB5]|uniref:Uncharacterized protein n=1 Tax=Streptomyces smaragdinus TaxID=2585196 RepID=A0A7K0CTQ4_9ACTN|nr:hypothetical protein [Streptomyces smaragdinus]MQY16382.1 hypothetical protein [Streptomyces smaragdinus]
MSMPPPQLDPGKALLKSSAALFILAPAVFFALIAVMNLLSDSSTTQAGDCVSLGDNDSIEVVDCTSTDAEFTVAARVDGRFGGPDAQARCDVEAPGSPYTYISRGDSSSYILCLKSR